jgi:hypothetical protein
MLIKVKNWQIVTALSFLSTVSLLMLSAKIETYAALNTNLNHVTPKPHQTDYLIVKDEDNDEDTGDHIYKGLKPM